MTSLGAIASSSQGQLADTDAVAALRNRLSDRSAQKLAGKVCLRPSGTEPKAKAYLEVCSDPRAAGLADHRWRETCAAVDSQIHRLATDFLARALATIGQAPPSGGVKLSR